MMTDNAMMLSLPQRNMKSRIRRNWSLGLALAVLPLAGGQPQESFSQTTNAIPAVEPQAMPKAAAPVPAAPDPALAEQTAENDVVDAPAKTISTAKPLPPSVKLTAPVAEVLKLADSGVEEGVMLAFVTNSTSTFNLGAEEIIYLNDLGVPSEVVTAMIRRDQVLRELSANAAAAPPAALPEAATPPAPEPAPASPPTEMAPQPDYTTGSDALPADSAYEPFYDSLAPYGTWVDVEGYGPCWQPTVVIVNPGWQPYCDGGRWVYTDCGWYWLSGYSWGWAPFHYGRWFYHHHLGWCWQPGNTWGPSWVCWRHGGNYFGWAPLPPAAGFRAGVGLTFHGQRVNSGFGFGLGARSYTFVPASHFSDRHLNRSALPRQEAAQIYSQTVPSATIVGNSTRVVNRGIPVSQVETATHTQIRRVSIREANTPGAQGVRGERLDGNSRTLSVFRPQFPQSTGSQPAAGGRSRSEIRPGSTRAAATAPPLILRGPDRSREAATQPWQAFMTAETEAPAQPRSSIARSTESRALTERPQQYSTPTYSAPVQVPRSVSAPAPAPQPVRSYSPPASAPPRPAEPSVSQPARSAPSAPAPSAPAEHSSSSSGRGGR